jgi:hypothetical protein
MSKGVELIAAERKRQVEKEGFDAGHDEQHGDDALAWAAACYAAPGRIWVAVTGSGRISFQDPWPDWDPEWDKRKKHPRLRQLVIAGAFIAAEIDRIEALPKCRVCGCTEFDCRQCIEAQGFPCHWVESDLCSRCADEKIASSY